MAGDTMMANAIGLMSSIFNSAMGILSSHFWVYIVLWLAQFVVVVVYINQKNKSISDVGSVLGKFRLFFIIALLIGFYLGSTIG